MLRSMVIVLATMVPLPLVAWEPPVDPQLWRTVLRSESFSMSYERRSVERHPRDLFRLWVRFDYRDPQNVSGEDGPPVEYNQIRQFEEFDCARSRARTGARFLIDAQGREVAVFRQRHDWREMDGESVDGRFFAVFCAEVRRRYGGQ